LRVEGEAKRKQVKNAAAAAEPILGHAFCKILREFSVIEPAFESRAAEIDGAKLH
jgi:hypothetical protein